MTEPTNPAPLPPAESAGLPSAADLRAPAPAPRSPAPAASDNTMGGVIDTVEAILIALILALTFRAFVVEAFVIPTGSMAPTLLGAHFNVICPKCGYHYTADADLTYQYSSASNSINRVERGELISNTNIPCDSLPTICPNCSYAISPLQFPQYLREWTANFDQRENRGLNPVRFAWANNGDRILVLKYLYSIMEPQRWDVIVFKEPMSARDNYIKRLIGLPNETVEIINGDVFIAPPDKKPQPGQEIDPHDLQIARKPPNIQEALWQLVYDNDFYPIDENAPRDNGTKWANPWIGAGSNAGKWEIHGPVINYSANTAGSALFSIRDPYTLNTLGYNRDIGESVEIPDIRRVGDLRLECTWIPREQSGRTVALVAGMPRNQYKVLWKPEGVELLRYDLSANPPQFVPVPITLASQLPDLVPGRGYHVALNNVDRCVQFFVDGKMIFEHLTPWNAADARREMAEVDESRGYITEKPDVRLEVGGACTIAHLKVMRDLYYTQEKVWAQPRSQARSGDLGTANASNPLTLEAAEYFAMGDNSRKSHDGRRWAEVYPALDDLGTRRGIVPQRFLLGKAFFVYWPAGYRPNPNIPVLNAIPIVPNAGDMRFIR